ncbi:MAG: hypothetical protein H0X35_16405 [Pseudonocardiales bacterium]|nr:hypothetical protein [Pseudonocardiales bacterium]
MPRPSGARRRIAATMAVRDRPQRRTTLWTLGIPLPIGPEPLRGSRSSPAADLEEQAIRAADAAGLESSVAAALGSLPRRDRDVAELCLLHGLTTAAAAVALGIPEGTVKSRLSRTRGQLRRLLQTGESVNAGRPTGNARVERPSVAPAGGLPR